ncbi:MAG: hypothetical protein Q7T33_13190 [Dehalococcoidia bacterium]|nr:hypothetical protein [Dehalococcoidia bacterium]
MRWIALAGVAVLALVAAACSSGDAGQPDPADSPGVSAQLTQSAEAGGITVEATWLTGDNGDGVEADLSGYPLAQFVLLDIKLDTHSGDLESVNMEQAAGLEQAGVAARPEAWVSEADDSHHREGVLVFRRDLKGGPVTLAIDLGGKQVELLWRTQP